MEDEYSNSPSRRGSAACILEMNSQSEPEPEKPDLDVLYPFFNAESSKPTVDKDALHNFLSSDELDSLMTDTHMSAKLDDLLEGEKFSRRYSLVGIDSQPDLKKIKNMRDRYTYYDANTGSVKNNSLKELFTTRATPNETVSDLLSTTPCWWIDIMSPTDQEMRMISKIFKLHPLTAEDIQAQEAREKCEIFQNYMFVSFQSFNHDYSSQDYLEAANFYNVVFKDGVLTFHFQPLPHPHNVRKRIHQLRDFITMSPEWINYALIDNITDSFAPLIQHSELEVDSIDDLVLVLNGSEQTDMLRRIGSCRKTVMQLMRLLGPKADVVRSLMKRYEDRTKEIEYLNRRRQQRMLQPVLAPAENLQKEKNVVNNIHHEIVLFLGDIQDHIQTMLQNVNHYDLVLGRAHRNYLGQISIELSQAGNSTNEVINRLTFLATLVVPLNLVAGLFGMNVHVPGQDNPDLAWFFWIVLGMALYVVFMLAFGKRFQLL
ncbi:cora-domain-containing protein [Hesseltinella vesiculosa]|uniref:Cora-domain-containing protein n=1 Tax=Hesseltinella vesiculosa TaxID=101127 RepID=A0A1X2GLM3_9FUNG|nr:cora-domain-containing protein [Hesseltinella vesiculosa]